MVQSEFGIKKTSRQDGDNTSASGGGGVKMWEIISRHTLDPLVPVKQLFSRSESKTAFHNISSSK